MKIAVISYSGNVGKSTVVRHLLAPRFPDAAVIAIESTNAGAAGATVIRGHQYASLLEFMQICDDVIVDIGASNIEPLLARMAQYRDSHVEFDAFIVPATPPSKQQQDTIATLVELSRLGIPCEKIRLVFNMVEYPTEIERTFFLLLAFLRENRIAEFSLDCCLQINEIYARMQDIDIDIVAVAEDPTDYKAQIAATTDNAARLTLARRLATKRLAQGVMPELDACFAALKLTRRENASAVGAA